MTSPGTQAPNTQPLNVISIVGFVLSLVGFNVVAIILGAIGLSQIKRTGERGRGFALAAIWIGALSIIIAIVIIIVTISIAAATGIATTN